MFCYGLRLALLHTYFPIAHGAAGQRLALDDHAFLCGVHSAPRQVEVAHRSGLSRIYGGSDGIGHFSIVVDDVGTVALTRTAIDGPHADMAVVGTHFLLEIDDAAV